MPESWDRQHLLNLIREAVGTSPKVGQSFDVAPGVFGVIKPFGVDLAGISGADGRLQVWLAVRRSGTDPAHVTQL